MNAIVVTPWDASRWDTFVWFLTVTVDKILLNCLRNLLKQYCPKLSEALPSEIWKTMPPFPEAFDRDYEDGEQEKKNRKGRCGNDELSSLATSP